ncbi:MAG TPA: ABC transporter ATP-binding protein [Hungateiclostridium thermocellum]|jgi:oligopeptide transport system ATP-binding protein|uniref:Oligopeptide/dipeptide ABC transporter, ATPase subunit n=2 Tax=Acetivibrio thermocellus TaxID=1515 RepID=A3DJN1_ACET2|nr:ABC transporter ATP-binding protein [Acetivibrio thermocellus]ABN54160.1 oligopeptide/dipeptide ABC transporter, ATPase subunit [Acetivibrio thermocellus ATCC 27405]ADU73597.1 oligopeptide/dipeptide ABC transporter, ATPase subunit [Acetivibrio thermocellus DSM 1313]ALX07523.1 oligopeptide/dipeptide ABC transporter, ATPase subunit [Acetivibrio thermocellus AD2]ANV75264.1 oligopeptide/dipeptide ABC transporter, ATPase subunit [Acetivibrio thermocellus DSM 2360]EIC03455.1 oligopeptide/dipeptid
MSKELLKINDLKVSFFTPAGEVKAVNGISYTLEPGKVLGIVGESGSGKSVSSYSIMGLIDNPGKIVGGSIIFDGKDVSTMTKSERQNLAGNEIAMIFQDPMTCLNPVFTIGNQIAESLIHKYGRKISKKEIKERSIDLLKLVGINEPEKRLAQYPHEFSGGMRQRVMIAMALAGSPKLLIADEPTTALDVTIQAQILELLKDIQKKTGMAIILITHDLGIVADMADDIIVMYAGKIVEQGSVYSIFNNPRHPYTKGLLRSLPDLNKKGEKLIPIQGNPIDLLNLPQGCAFAPRCENCMKVCLKYAPKEYSIEDGHTVSCWLYDGMANNSTEVKNNDKH